MVASHCLYGTRSVYDVRANCLNRKFSTELGLFPLQGEAPMPASGIAAVSPDLRSHFLDGLAPPVRKTILGATTQRRFHANSFSCLRKASPDISPLQKTAGSFSFSGLYQES